MNRHVVHSGRETGVLSGDRRVLYCAWFHFLRRFVCCLQTDPFLRSLFRS
jgi:hypothetical protein